MLANRSLAGHLKEFIRLLKMEKKALIANDGELISQIVNKKQEFATFFTSITVQNIQSDHLKWLNQIQELQATNLLLTKQALSYQANLIAAIAQSAKKSGTTYSKKGYVNLEEDLSLINHSV